MFNAEKKYLLISILLLTMVIAPFVNVNAVSALEPVQDLKINESPVGNNFVLPIGSRTATLTATIPVGSAISLVLNNVNSNHVSTGVFTRELTSLEDGENILDIQVQTPSGQSWSRKISILVDTGQPQVYGVTPEHNSVRSSNSADIKGYVHRMSGLRINGVNVTLSSTGSFTHQVSLALGDNQFSFTTPTGQQILQLVIRYSDAPEVQVTYPTAGLVINTTNMLAATGAVNLNTSSLKVRNGSLAGDVDKNVTLTSGTGNKNFETPLVRLVSGENNLIFSAYNSRNQMVSLTRKVIYNGSPAIFITDPTATGIIVNKTPYTVKGRVYNIISGGLKLNGVTISPDSLGYFTVPVNLQPNINNKLTFTANDETTTITKIIDIMYDNSPVVNITSPAPNASATSSSVKIKGTAVNCDSLFIDGKSVALGSDGSFIAEVKLTKVTNVFTVRAKRGNFETEKEVTVNYIGKPAITITSPINGSSQYEDTVSIKGTVFPIDTTDISMTVNGQLYNVSVDSNGKFDEDVALDEGENKIVVTAYNGPSSNSATKEIKVTYDTSPQIHLDDITNNMTVYSNKLTVSGTVENALAGSLKINSTAVSFDSSGDFSHDLYLKAGTNTITLTVSGESSGKTKSKAAPALTYTIYYNDVAKQEAEVELNIKRAEKITAFSGLVAIETGAEDHLTNKLIMKVVDPYDVHGRPAASAFLGPLVDIDFDTQPEQVFKLTLKYDEVIKEAQAAKITVFYLDDYNNSWVILGGVVDTTSRTVSVKADKEGVYVAALYFKSFNDTNVHWGKRDIEYLVAQGVASGVSESNFNPDGIITRAEFAVFLAKACGLKGYEPYENSFIDLDSDHWAFPYVEAAARAGIITGVSAERFGPNQLITREQAAVMLARAVGIKAVETTKAAEILKNFRDGGRVGLYANLEVATVLDIGLMKGMPDGYFRPKGTTTRAQAVAMVVRLMEHLQKGSQDKKAKKTR